MSAPSAERNLHFGLIALEMRLVTRGQLLDALSACLSGRESSLGQALRQAGALSEGDCRAVEEAVRQDQERGAGSTDLPEAAGATVDHLAGTMPPLGAAPVPRGTAGALRYRKLREHARGGLGEVHVALDEELGREVALKEIQPRHADREDFRARFVREAELTGQLEHPGIVPVHGLGHYEDGRPYYAMRFIKGEAMLAAIQRFHQGDAGRRDAGERELALRSLLTRFVAMCNAVAYAHSRGILHRDLKPENVMLGEYGETLVFDWGLAKRVGQQEGALAAVSGEAGGTEMGQAVGTPAYMAPEQANGRLDEIGPASDVFALGATLYHLLTGRAPYSGSGALIQAAMAEAPPASRINPRVARSLEAVCARAMAPRPEDRYLSAKDLAADVERWLADEPVSAYRDPPSQRLRRWAKRNRTLVAAAGALLLASVAGLALGLWAVNAQKQRTAEALEESEKNLRLAETNFRLARKVVESSFGIAKDHPLLARRQLSDEMHQFKRLLLEKALPFYQDFRIERPDDPEVQWDLWEQHFKLGYIYYELNQPARAVTHYSEAAQAGRRLAAASANPAESQKGLAATLNNLGVLQKAQGRHDEAARSLTEAIAINRELVRAHPDDIGHQMDLANHLLNLGNLHRELGRRKEAIASYTETAALCRAAIAAQPRVLSHRIDLADVLNNLGLMNKDLGRREEARRQYAEAVRVARFVAGEEREVPSHRATLGRALNNLAELQRQLGRPLEALASYVESAALRRALVRAQPAIAEYREGLADALNNLGSLLDELGRHKEALECLDESAEAHRALADAQPAVPGHRAALARTLTNLAQLQGDLGQRAEALASYAEAATLRRALVQAYPSVPTYRVDLAITLNNQGTLLDDMGRLDDALASYTEAASLRRALTREHPDVPGYRATLAVTLNNQGMVLRLVHRPKEALACYTESVELIRALAKQQPSVPKYRSDLAATLNNLGALQRELLRNRDALASFTESVALRRALIKEQPAVPGHRDQLARALTNLAMLQERLGQRPEALANGIESVEVRRALVKSHPAVPSFQEELIRNLNNLALLQANLARYRDAILTYTEAIEVGRRLVRAYPSLATYQLALSRPLLNRALERRLLRQYAGAKEDADEALTLLLVLRQRQPRLAGVAPLLLVAHRERASALQGLGKPREALADWDNAVALSTAGARESFRRSRAICLALAGEYDRAAAEAADLGRAATRGDDLMDLACILARCASRPDPTRPLPVRERLAEQRAREAVALLGRAAKAGHFRIAANIVQMERDPDLAVLRDRADYKAWRTGLFGGKE